MRIHTLSLLAALAAGAAVSAQAPHDPHDAMHARGAHVMGFDQDATTHHFYLYADGGAIDVAANDAGDGVNVDAIRSHLPHIAQMLGSGDYSSPMLVHATSVPGTADLTRLKNLVRFTYVETPRGARRSDGHRPGGARGAPCVSPLPDQRSSDRRFLRCPGALNRSRRRRSARASWRR